MVKKTTGAGVQRCYRGDVIRAQFEVEHVQILRHAFFAHGLGQSHDAALRQPTEYHLRDALLVLRGDRSQRWILEDMIPPLRKRRPCLWLNPIGLQELLGLALLKKRIDFDLIDSGRQIVVQHEVNQSVRWKVGHANRPDFTRAIQLLHRAPLAVYVAERLVNEIQVQVIQLQTLHGSLKGGSRPFIALSLNPQLCGDKELLPGDAAPPDPSTHGRLVEIRRGRVDQAIANVDRVDYALFAYRRIGNLEHAEPQDGHHDAIVECDLLHDPLYVPRSADLQGQSIARPASAGALGDARHVLSSE